MLLILILNVLIDYNRSQFVIMVKNQSCTFDYNVKNYIHIRFGLNIKSKKLYLNFFEFKIYFG
jgi:hypothetical protein